MSDSILIDNKDPVVIALKDRIKELEESVAAQNARYAELFNINRDLQANLDQFKTAAKGLAGTAVAILNESDSTAIHQMATEMADILISMTDVPDL